MVRRGRRGFTLIELLVVIVIILLLMALILPAIVRAICNARQGATKTMVMQLTAATDMYQNDWAVYPPGDGKGSKDLAVYLGREGPKKLPYFVIHREMLTTDAKQDFANPTWPENTGPEGRIYYRNNIAQSGQPPGGGNQPPVYNRKGVDMWCAGCGFEAGVSNTLWITNNWE